MHILKAEVVKILNKAVREWTACLEGKFIKIKTVLELSAFGLNSLILKSTLIKLICLRIVRTTLSVIML